MVVIIFIFTYILYVIKRYNYNTLHPHLFNNVLFSQQFLAFTAIVRVNHFHIERVASGVV